jgi:DNA/RNA non-specific endonuclease
VSSNLISIKCAGNNKFTVPGLFELVSLDAVTCQKPITPDIEDLPKRGDCEGVMKSVGFKYVDKNGKPYFVELYKSCINMATKQVHWVEHFLNGNSIEGRAGSNPNNYWLKVGFGQDGVDLENAYKKDSQVQNGLIPSLGAINFLAKGHLFPDGDSIFLTHSRATYTYFNAVPQWQSINNGNWKSIEQKIRCFSYVSAGTSQIQFKPIRIQTGGYGSQLNLAPTGPPIPKWIYKIVYITDTKYILFNIFNNPSQIMTNDHLCPFKDPSRNLCAQSVLWYVRNHNNFESGQVYCCEIETSHYMKIASSIQNFALLLH